jgi:hypothetical protein
MSNQDTATQYRWAAEDLELELKEQQRELRGAEAVRASEQAQLQRLENQRQLAVLPADRARLDNSIELAQRRVARSNSEVEQIGQKVQQTQSGINYNREEERKALGGPPAANNVPPPGPAAVPPPNPTPLNAQQQAAQPPLATPVNPSPAAVTPAQRGDNGGFVTNAQGELVPADSAEADEIRAEQNRVESERSAPQREFVYDPETGEMVASDSDQALALREEESREQNRARFANAEPQPEFVYDEVTGEMVPGDSGRAAEIRAEQAPGPVPPTLSAVWDSESGSWGVWADPPGEIQQSGFATEAEATAAAGDQFEAQRLQREAELAEDTPATFGPEPVAPSYTAIWDSETGSYGIWEDPPGVFRETGFATQEEAERAIADIAPDVDLPTPPDDGLTDEERAAQAEAAAQAAAKEAAINQATRNSVYKKEGSSDWRLRLQLAPTSTYLYNANPAGILQPLAATNGVIFPYTPQINTAYRANYEQYDLVHSNYRGVYYKNSRVDDLNIRGVFTAQDTQEADYLLAVIHFFRSVTKMFYGKDDERGTPPPLVFLSGFGMNQFYGHPCVVSNFTYALPDNVDYIRATNYNNYGTDLLSRRTPSKSSGVAGLGASGNRILNAGLEKFFPANKPTPDTVTATVNSTQLANYVPTKMEIDITLIPVQTRSQVSKQFSLKGFANGDLIKGGFW